MAKTCKAPGCNRPVFGGGYCQYYSHQQMRTDPSFLRRREKKLTVVKIRYEIPKITKKQAAANAIYAARQPSWKLENPFCAFPGCGLPTTECHHSRGRGRYLNREDTFIPFCQGHHSWAEGHPKEARKLNFTKSRLTNE